MPRVIYFSLLILAVFLTSHTSAKLTVFTPEPLFNRTFQTAQIYFQGLPDSFPNITGRLVPFEYAEQHPGSIVLVYTQPPPEELIRKVQATGAIAIIITPKSRSLAFQPGESYINTDNKDTTDIVVPVAEVLNVFEFYDELLDLTAQNISVEVLLTSEELNLYKDLVDSFWSRIFQVIMGSFCLVNLGLAIWRIVIFAQISKTTGSKLPIPFTVLAFLVIANITRVIALVDYNGFGKLYTYAAKIFLSSLPSPFISAAAFLIAFYWHECLKRSSIVVSPFLKKLKIPFYCICAGLFAFEYIAAILHIYNMDSWLYVFTAIYIAITLALAIFYLTVAAQVLKRLDAGAKQFKRRSVSKKASIMMIMTGVSIIGWSCSFGLFIPFQMTPYAQMVLYFFLIFFSHCISFFIIMTFIVSANNAPKKSSGGSTETGTGTGTGSSKVDSTKVPDSARVRSDSFVMTSSSVESTTVLSATPKDLEK
eukprot:TRINITY_DN2067_c0_g1_i1.p1 TRINITY_DN2067_c0_g1~~TRINITY_DN2067_c0_g1_i1.p1  ORF type:complete len:479 (+),score=90.99 TRINITY_DN2067_c0_g1_i1:90-1526(+)